tara:strand:+ start:25616 stop:25846 length:231 start_codon:yes stop_codon:yes gene_type:complete
MIMNGQKYIEIPVSKPIPIKKSSDNLSYVDKKYNNQGIFFFVGEQKFHDETKLYEKQKMIRGQNPINFKRRPVKNF